MRFIFDPEKNLLVDFINSSSPLGEKRFDWSCFFLKPGIQLKKKIYNTNSYGKKLVLMKTSYVQPGTWERKNPWGKHHKGWKPSLAAGVLDNKQELIYWDHIFLLIFSHWQLDSNHRFLRKSEMTQKFLSHLQWWVPWALCRTLSSWDYV